MKNYIKYSFIMIISTSLILFNINVLSYASAEECPIANEWKERAELAQARLRELLIISEEQVSDQCRYIMLIEEAYASHMDKKSRLDVYKEDSNTMCYLLRFNLCDADTQKENWLIVEYHYDKTSKKLLFSKATSHPINWTIMNTGTSRNKITLYDQYGNCLCVDLGDPFNTEMLMANK